MHPSILDVDARRRRASFFCRTVTVLAVALGQSSMQPADAQPGLQLIYDMKVHADPSDPTKGWVTDGHNNPLYGSPSSTQVAPLPWALERTGPSPMLGTKIQLRAGTYAPFEFDPFSSSAQAVGVMGGAPGAPVHVYGENGTVIGPNNTGGGSTMTVRGKVPNHSFHQIRWYDVTWMGGNAGACILVGACSDANNGIQYNGWKFFNCEMDGGFDHKSGTGFNSKWGMRAYSMSGFLWRGGTVHDVKQEHGFYMSTFRGNGTIQGVTMWELGRTAIQIVARVDVFTCLNMPENPGDILINGNYIADIGLQPGDYHAGTAITITGRQNGITRILDNTVEFGFDTFTPGLRHAILNMPDYPVSKPYGTGAVIHWTENKTNHLWSNELIMEDNTIAFQDNSGGSSCRGAVGARKGDLQGQLRPDGRADPGDRGRQLRQPRRSEPAASGRVLRRREHPLAGGRRQRVPPDRRHVRQLPAARFPELSVSVRTGRVTTHVRQVVAGSRCRSAWRSRSSVWSSQSGSRFRSGRAARRAVTSPR